MDYAQGYVEFPEQDEDFGEGVYIEDETVWDEPEYEVEPAAPSPLTNPPHQQQILIGYPPAPLTTTHGHDSPYFCKLYPDECSGSKLIDDQHGNCSAYANCSTGPAEDKLPTLANVDLSGLGLGVLLVIFLLLAVHLAWDSDGKSDGEWRRVRR